MAKFSKLFVHFFLFTNIFQIIIGETCFCEQCKNKCDNGPNFHKWVVEEKEISPDNFVQVGKTINGKFPGPTIRISTNEYLVVKVVNRLTTGISIHWHGLHQQRTLSSDGADFVTQPEIPINGTYTYCIYINGQVGTYFYHAHSHLDIVWIHGALIIEDRPILWTNPIAQASLKYHEDRIILLGQLYHTPISTFMQILLVTGGTRPKTESLLINGRSYGEWPSSNCENCEGEGYSVVNVKKGLIYRLRLINLSADQLIRFSIQNHTMTVIEMDGIFTNPIPVDYVLLHAAQRYSILVKMNQNIDNYWMESQSVPGPGPKNGAAILHYQRAPDPKHLKIIPRPGKTDPLPLNNWITPQLYPNPSLYQESVYPVPKNVTRNIYIDFRIVLIPPVSRFTINGHIYMEPTIPYLEQVRNGVNITDEPQVFEVLEGQEVQVILQNRAGGFTSHCDPHPWHFHGRFFYVVAHGPDEFEEDRDYPLIQENVNKSKGKHEFRDVFIQYPQQTVANYTAGAGCGWSAVRFVANNAGLWLTHCHITPHMIIGKMFVIWEHSLDNPRLYGE